MSCSCCCSSNTAAMENEATWPVLHTQRNPLKQPMSGPGIREACVQQSVFQTSWFLLLLPPIVWMKAQAEAIQQLAFCMTCFSKAWHVSGRQEAHLWNLAWLYIYPASSHISLMWTTHHVTKMESYLHCLHLRIFLTVRCLQAPLSEELPEICIGHKASRIVVELFLLPWAQGCWLGKQTPSNRWYRVFRRGHKQAKNFGDVLIYINTRTYHENQPITLQESGCLQNLLPIAGKNLQQHNKCTMQPSAKNVASVVLKISQVYSEARSSLLQRVINQGAPCHLAQPLDQHFTGDLQSSGCPTLIRLRCTSTCSVWIVFLTQWCLMGRRVVKILLKNILNPTPPN